MIYVTHHHAVPILIASMERVHVCPNSKVTHTLGVDLNAYKAQNVIEIKLAWATNARIHVQGRVLRMQFAMSLITYRCAVAQTGILVMLLWNVGQF